MSEEQHIKEKCLQMAAKEIEELFTIIGDLGYVGYKISMCKLRGFSYQQCANRLKISKRQAQVYFEKCTKNGYDIALKKLFNIK